MNKIKVNMAVEPNDIQTLHCSQYDTEERKFSVELHENGVGVSPSSISNQLVYKSFKGGTEQILPTNTSTPSTSPIIADINYKDGLREDEEFLYRESPSDVDGYAKIKEIRGNTIVWNQWVKNGNFADSSEWQYGNCALSVSNNVMTVSSTGSASQLFQGFAEGCKAGTKFYVSCEVKASANRTVRLRVSQNSPVGQHNYDNFTITANTNTKISMVKSIANDIVNTRFSFFVNESESGDTYEIKNFIAVNLTKMFGSGNEPTIAEFEALFPLPYYNYTQGELLSFNGSGIKTTGFNQWDEEWEQGSFSTSTGEKTSSTARIRSKNMIPVLSNESYYIKSPYNTYLFFYDGSGNYLGFKSSNSANSIVVLTDYYPNVGYINIRIENSGADYANDVCVNISSSKNGTYEPYTSSTLSLPISTYFPTGMKSAGSIYDQLDETGYITRVGKIVLDGTQTIIASNFQSGSPKQCRIFVEVPNVKGTTATSVTDTGIVSSYLMPSSNVETYNGQAGIHRRSNGATQLCVSLGAGGYDSGITTEALFNQYLASHPLTVFYEIGTPLENYGVVDLGSLTWTDMLPSGRFTAEFSFAKPVSSGDSVANIVCAEYPTGTNNMTVDSKKCIAIRTNGYFVIYDSTFVGKTNAQVKEALSGVYVLYEAINPQGIKTASIVTNYGEMPLYNDNGELKADCIADVSQNSGFQIAKVKLKDENGEIYSNPFQIHTERSPQ